MLAFKDSCEILTKLILDKSISFGNLRKEHARVEFQYEKLREEKADAELVGAGFRKCREDEVIHLQTKVISRGSENGLRDAAKNTKTETVMLARFCRDKFIAYLRYPVCRKQ